MEASLQLSVIDSLKFGCCRVQKGILSLGVDSAPVKYLQLIMLQLLVSPFSLPSSQMIFKKISQFLKTIFSLLKKY